MALRFVGDGIEEIETWNSNSRIQDFPIYNSRFFEPRLMDLFLNALVDKGTDWRRLQNKTELIEAD